MRFTGERLVPHVNEYYTYEHLHRYYLACEMAEGKDVLDIASGEGYGSALLAARAKKVTGVDLEAEAVAHSLKTYVKDNLSFIQGDVRSIPLDDHTFDIVTCFETIEHVTEHEAVVMELKRVLRPDGVLLISTPDAVSNHPLASRGRNPFHPEELTKEQFTALLEKSFSQVELLYQQSINASLIVSEEASMQQMKEYRGGFSEFEADKAKNRAQYFIAVCSDRKPDKSTDSVLTYDNTRKSLVEKVIFKIRNWLK